MRFAWLSLLMLLTALTRLQAQTSDASHKVDINIAAESLDKALTDLGDQTGLTIIVGSGTGAEKMLTPGLKGSFVPEDALHKLLAPTGLSAERYPEGGFEIKPHEKSRPVPHPKPDGSNEPSNALEEVAITASHIRGIPGDISPVNSYSHEDIERSGATTLAQFLRAVPQNFSLVNPETSTGAANISPQAGVNVARGEALDLRGLSPGATLVLVDGQRLAPAGFDGSFVDVSMFPLGALDHVDALSDGASAIYGSDAVAGVVNLVMRPDFEGFQTTPYYSYTTGGGGDERGLSQLAGHKWSATNGAMVAYDYYRQQPVEAASRQTLVPQPGRYQVIPSQQRQSAVVKLHEWVTARTELKLSGRYSERTFDQSYLSAPAVETQSRGRAKMLGGSVAAVRTLPGDWTSDFVGAYDRHEETLTTSASTTAQSFQTRSSVASVDWRGSGRVISTAGGVTKLSLGASWRWEGFDYLGARFGPTPTALNRKVLSVYGGAFVPIVGEGNQSPWVKRLELLLAIRYDDYRNGEVRSADAASDDPRVNLLWSPRAGLLLRASYATSFRIAPLAQTNASGTTVLLTPLSNPSVHGGEINTLYITGANPSLRPEFAKSFTVTIDYEPSALPRTSFSSMYFNVHYNNRIAAPPVVGTLDSIYTQLSALRPYINTSPSATDIQKVYDQHTVLDPMQIGQAAVHAIFDSRLQNIAKTEESGVDVLARSAVKTDFGDLEFLLQGQYLVQLLNQAAPTAPFVSVANTPFNSPRLRMQATLGWSAKSSRGDWEVWTTLNHTGSYRDTLSAGAPRVGSWLTLNCHLAYTTGASFASTPLENVTLAINVLNLADRPVPRVDGLRDQTLGHDPSNAFAIGRAIGFGITKRW